MSYKNKILGSILANYNLIDMYNIQQDLFADNHREIFNMCIIEKSMGFKSFDGSGFDKDYIKACSEILNERINDRNFEHYLRLHSEEQKKIDLRELCERIITQSQDKESKVNDLIGNVYSGIGCIKNNAFAVDDVYHPSDMCEIIDRFENGEIKTMSDVKYGYELLDKYALGMHPKQISLLAARTGTGKSTFAINVLKNVGVLQKHKILYLSNEMDKERTVKRLQSSISGIDSEYFSNMNPTQKHLYGSAREKIKNSKMIITGNMPKTIADASLIIRKNNVDKDLKVVIYDYLGETKNDNIKGIKDWERLTIYVQQLLEIAKEQNIHIIILNQFSKESEKSTSFSSRGNMLGGSEILHKADRFFYFDFDKAINKYVLSIDKNRDGECIKIIYDFYKNTQQILERGMYEEPDKQEKEMPF